MSFSIRSTVLFAFVTSAALLAGCGGGGGAEHQTAPVKGKITFQGQPVKGGSITFRPTQAAAGAKAGVAGKPAGGTVGDDGTFVLSTYGDKDGAVIGKHQILYTPMMIGAKDYNDKPAPSPYLGLSPQPADVEVKPGPNDIPIELVKK